MCIYYLACMKSCGRINKIVHQLCFILNLNELHEHLNERVLEKHYIAKKTIMLYFLFFKCLFLSDSSLSAHVCFFFCFVFLLL